MTRKRTIEERRAVAVQRLVDGVARWHDLKQDARSERRNLALMECTVEEARKAALHASGRDDQPWPIPCWKDDRHRSEGGDMDETRWCDACREREKQRTRYRDVVRARGAAERGIRILLRSVQALDDAPEVAPDA